MITSHIGWSSSLGEQRDFQWYQKSSLVKMDDPENIWSKVICQNSSSNRSSNVNRAIFCNRFKGEEKLGCCFLTHLSEYNRLSTILCFNWYLKQRFVFSQIVYCSSCAKLQSFQLVLKIFFFLIYDLITLPELWHLCICICIQNFNAKN